MKYNQRHSKGKTDRDTRLMLGKRFKALYRMQGLNRDQAAKLLHVSERTLHNWETGIHEIPYSAYKLLRLMAWTELPGQWNGWHIAGNKLWSPEGHCFEPHESAYWSNLCRRAEMFGQLYRQVQKLKLEAADQLKRREVLVTPHFSLKKETDNKKTQYSRGFTHDCPNIKFAFLKTFENQRYKIDEFGLQRYGFDSAKGAEK